MPETQCSHNAIMPGTYVMPELWLNAHNIRHNHTMFQTMRQITVICKANDTQQHTVLCSSASMSSVCHTMQYLHV